jgi:WD40 repeat protein
MKTLTITRGNFFGVDYTADGRYLVSGNSGRHIRIWDLTTFTERVRFVLPYSAVARANAFFLHAPRLVLGSSVWDLTRAWAHLEGAKRDLPPEGELFAKLELDTPTPFVTLAAGLAGDLLVGSVWLGGMPQRTQLFVWGPQGRRQRQLDAPQLTWGRLALAPDGRSVAAVLHPKRALLIDLSDGQTVAELIHTDAPQVLRFSPDGRLLAVAAGRTIWLWDVPSRTPLARFPAFQRHAEALAFHRSGQFLAAGSREGEVRLWDTSDRKQVACLDWKIGGVHGLAFSPDGMTVAAAGHNGAIVIWDLE